MAVLDTDIQVDYWYKFTLGMPCDLFMQLMSHCMQLGYVQHAWAMGIVVRVGAVDILFKHAVHGSKC